ncbi:hypothetical protein [Streptomyces sp. 7N604]|uniref:hypothetical protein n=1 Tax=Streptomyces sp. 7N604 TaxID=3457415 RepID=UPI003FCF4B9B
MWAKTFVDHGCFLLYAPPAFAQDNDLTLRLGENIHRMLLCTPSGVAARSAVTNISYASVSIEVYDTEPATALEWAVDAMECDLVLNERLQLHLQSLTSTSAAIVSLGQYGTWRLRAHRRPSQYPDTETQEEWLFHLWPLPEPHGDPAEEAAIHALLRRAVPPHS